MITREFLSEKASRRGKMLNAIFEMKFSFMWLHLFPLESTQSGRLIERACPWHTPNSKIFISFWHSLKSQSGTKGTLLLLHFLDYTYSLTLSLSRPSWQCCFSCLSVTTMAETLNATSLRTQRCWPHTGRPDTDVFQQLGPIKRTELNFLVVVRLHMCIFHA